MSYEVDVWGAWNVTLSPGQVACIELYQNPDIGPGQWFRPAVHLNRGSQPGAAVTIISEGAMTDNNLSTGMGLCVKNVGTPTPQSGAIGVVTVNVLSSPSHF
jgi:hypothetical protein